MGVGMYRVGVAAAAIVAAVVLVTTLAGPPQYAFAEMAPTPINLTMAGRISDDDGLNLYAINDIATFESAGRAYAVIISGGGVQVLDLTDPHNIVPAGLHPSGGGDIAIFESADRIYAAIISSGGVQVLDLTDPHNIVPAGHIFHDDGLTHIQPPSIAIFESAGHTYAITSLKKGLNDVTHDSLGMPSLITTDKTTITQVIDLTDPHNIFRADRNADNSYGHANDIVIFESANRTYAAWVSGSVLAMDLTYRNTLVRADSIGDSAGDLYLKYAWYGAAFESADRIYVAVTAYWEDGVQVLDLTDPYNIVPADGIGDDDNTVLGGARYIAAFESAGRTYAAVTSNEGVQVLDLTDPYNIVPAGHITNDNNRSLSGIKDIAIFESTGRTYAAVALYDDIQIIQLTDDADHSTYGNSQDDAPVNLVVTTHSPGCTTIFLLEYDVNRKTELRPTHLYSLGEMENGLNMTFGTHAAVASKLVPLLADRGEISSVASYSAGPSPILLEHDTNPDIDTNPFTGTIQLCDVLREPLLGAAVDALLADSGTSGSAPHQNLVPVRLDTDNLVETLTYLKENGAVVHLALESRDGDGGGSIDASVPVSFLLPLSRNDQITHFVDLVPEYMTTDDYGSIDTELHSVNGPEVAPEPEPLEIILQNGTARDGAVTITPPEPAGGPGTPYFGHEGMLHVLAAVGAVFGSVAAVFLVRARSGKYKASGVPAIRTVRP